MDEDSSFQMTVERPEVERARVASGLQWDLYRFRSGVLSEDGEQRIRDLIATWRETTTDL